jgi:hypothetical protein
MVMMSFCGPSQLKYFYPLQIGSVELSPVGGHLEEGRLIVKPVRDKAVF